MKKKFKLQDLDCANCAAKMEEAIKKIDGVNDASMSFMTQKLTLDADDARFDEILQKVVDTAKKIGLTMTESYMLTPVKSVTALIGISDSDEKCHIKGCESCTKTDCIYRRN